MVEERIVNEDQLKLARSLSRSVFVIRGAWETPEELRQEIGKLRAAAQHYQSVYGPCEDLLLKAEEIIASATGS